MRPRLAIGTLGDHAIAKLDWIGDFLEASMILTGMGSVAKLTTNGAKIFTPIFALFSELIFLGAVTSIVSPVLHRLMHKFHLDG